MTRFDHKSRIVLASLVSVAVLASAPACDETEKGAARDSGGVNALLLLSRNYGLNYFLNRDAFEEYGWKITITGALDTIMPCPAVAKSLEIKPLIPDVSIGEIDNIEEYDCLAIMPSAGSYIKVPDPLGDILKSREALRLVSAAAAKGLAVSALCSGVRVLAAADVIDGRNVVGAPRFKGEYEAAGATFLGNDHPPAIEDNIITGARDLYYSASNCQAVATVIENNRGRTGRTAAEAKDFESSDLSGFAIDGLIWGKAYGGSGADGGRALCETSDGGFLITGYTFSRGGCDPDILLVKIDSLGSILWSRTFGGPGMEYGYGCASLDDGYLVTGYTTSYGAGSKDVYLIRTDEDGNKLWSGTYGGSGWDVGRSVCEVEDGGYVVCGFTNSYGSGEEDVYLVRVDSEGGEIWSRTYGGERFEMGNCVHAVDEGFLMSATTGTFGGGNCNFYLIKTDTGGRETWSKSFGVENGARHGFDWCSAMSKADDGGAVLAGYTDCNDVMDVYVIKTDAKGDEMWSSSFGAKPFYDYGNSIVGTRDGGCVVCGVTKSIDGNNDFYMVKLDDSGEIEWEKSAGGPGSDWLSSVIVTRNGDLAALGHTDSCGQGSFDVCLIRMRDR